MDMMTLADVVQQPGMRRQSSPRTEAASPWRSFIVAPEEALTTSQCSIAVSSAQGSTHMYASGTSSTSLSAAGSAGRHRRLLFIASNDVLHRRRRRDCTVGWETQEKPRVNDVKNKGEYHKVCFNL